MRGLMIALCSVLLAAACASKSKSASLYDEEIDYGADAQQGKPGSIAADVKYGWPSFEAVLADLDGARAAFASGIDAVSERMVEQIHGAITR